MPRVTVLMPVHNGAEYLRDALASLWLQTVKDFEVLVVDDASTDETPSILDAESDPRLRVIRNEQNLGVAPSLNRGLRAARGAFIARLDADDRALPTRLAIQTHYLDTHPQAVLVGGLYTLIDHHGTVTSPTLGNDASDPEAIVWRLLWRNPFAHPSILFRRADALAGNGYPEDRLHSEDYGLWIRLAARGTLNLCPSNVLQLRKHNQNITTVHDRASIENALTNSLNAISTFTDHQYRVEEIRLLCYPREFPPASAKVGMLALERIVEIARTFIDRQPRSRRQNRHLRKAIAAHLHLLGMLWSMPELSDTAESAARAFDPLHSLRYAPLTHYFIRPCDYSL